jgi:hypothetical protein
MSNDLLSILFDFKRLLYFLSLFYDCYALIFEARPIIKNDLIDFFVLGLQAAIIRVIRIITVQSCNGLRLKGKKERNQETIAGLLHKVD